MANHIHLRSYQNIYATIGKIRELHNIDTYLGWIHVELEVKVQWVQMVLRKVKFGVSFEVVRTVAVSLELADAVVQRSISIGFVAV